MLQRVFSARSEVRIAESCSRHRPSTTPRKLSKVLHSIDKPEGAVNLLGDPRSSTLDRPTNAAASFFSMRTIRHGTHVSLRWDGHTTET